MQIGRKNVGKKYISILLEHTFKCILWNVHEEYGQHDEKCYEKIDEY
jgi:hypothetical protein